MEFENMIKSQFNPTSNDFNKRLDVFIAENINDISRADAKRFIDRNFVLVNDKNCECNKNVKSNYRLKENDIITVFTEKVDPSVSKVLPEDVTLEILFEDEDIIVINKPKNLVVHPAHPFYSNTLVNALLHHCGNNLSDINGEFRPGIVHRIDKDTSGILVCAKTNFAHEHLAIQFKEHSINRKYIAIVYNSVKNDQGTIDKPIGRCIKDRKRRAIVPNGKKAVTHYKVIERLSKYTFIEAQLETGRTHQIRVHMASIGNPVLGDSDYGKSRQHFKLESQVLHAISLGFVHPKTDSYIEFNTEIPKYIQDIIKNIKEHQES